MIVDSLRWLGRAARNIPLPLALHWESCDDDSYGGLYLKPSPKTYLVDGAEVECARGIIIVNAISSPAGREVANALAHEFRHHMQQLSGTPCPGQSFRQCLNREGTYERAIVRFFASNPLELDALVFSHRVAPSDSSANWMDLLQGARR